MVSRDTIFSTFKYADVDDVKQKRSTETIISTTKVIVLDVDESEQPIEQLHGFLKEFKHLIATTSDVNNLYKYRIIIPVDVELEANDLYRCIVRKLAEKLMVKIDPASAVPAQCFYGYKDAVVFSQSEGELMSIKDLVSECASDEAVSLKPVQKPMTKAAKEKSVQSILANVDRVFDYVINCGKGEGSLSLARASLHMRDQGFTEEQYTQVINYLNSKWSVPMDERRLETTVLKPYAHQMQ